MDTELTQEQQRELYESMREYIEPIMSELESAVPRRTGKLAASCKLSIDYSSIIIEFTAPYASIVESRTKFCEKVLSKYGFYGG